MNALEKKEPREQSGDAGPGLAGPLRHLTSSCPCERPGRNLPTELSRLAGLGCSDGCAEPEMGQAVARATFQYPGSSFCALL